MSQVSQTQQHPQSVITFAAFVPQERCDSAGKSFYPPVTVMVEIPADLLKEESRR